MDLLILQCSLWNAQKNAKICAVMKTTKVNARKIIVHVRLAKVEFSVKSSTKTVRISNSSYQISC